MLVQVSEQVKERNKQASNVRVSERVSLCILYKLSVHWLAA